MSPAKRKPKSSPGARPAARAAQRAQKPASVREPCGLPPLSRAFDDESERAHLLAHVPGCDSCSDQLEVIAVQREALGFLGDAETAPDGASAQAAVRRLLEQSAASGRAKLADMVYELSKACLFAAEDLNARLRRDTEPRPFGIVRRECDATLSRLDSTPRGSLPDSVPSSTDVTRARRAARSCQLILDQLEGETPRCVLLDSLVLIAERKPAEAESCLRTLLQRPLSRVERRFALLNLMWALGAQKRYAEAVTIGSSAADEYPSEWMFQFNLAVAYAVLGDERNLKRAANAAGVLASGDALPRLESLIRNQARAFSQTLGVLESEVFELFTGSLAAPASGSEWKEVT